MKTNGVHGLNYHLFPGDLSNKLDADIVANGLSKVVQGGNEIHLFVGAMPDEETLYAITKTSDLLDTTVGYGNSLAFSIGVEADDAIELNYTYDRAMKERVIKKWPVNAKSYIVNSDIPANSIITWAAIKLEGVTPTGEDEQIIFTDAIGTWNDPEICVLLNNCIVTGGDSVEFKDFTISGRDVLAEDVIAELAAPEITLDTVANVAGATSIVATFVNVVDGTNADVSVTLADGSSTNSYTAVVNSDAISLDISADFASGLATGDKIIINVAGTLATMIIA